jgi:hypothetical protein
MQHSNERRELDEILHDEREILRETQETHRDVEIIEQRLRPKLKVIKIQFSKGTIMSAAAGPVTLTSVGQTATASVLGFDQFGNPWTGALPPYTLTSDDTAGAIATLDPATGLVTAVADGVANITATLTTAEGASLADTEAVTVAIPVVPPPTPVLSSIKVAFA